MLNRQQAGFLTRDLPQDTFPSARPPALPMPRPKPICGQWILFLRTSDNHAGTDAHSGATVSVLHRVPVLISLDHNEGPRTCSRIIPLSKSDSQSIDQNLCPCNQKIKKRCRIRSVSTCLLRGALNRLSGPTCRDFTLACYVTTTNSEPRQPVLGENLNVSPSDRMVSRDTNVAEPVPIRIWRLSEPG